MIQDEHISVGTVILFCASMDISKPTIHGNITDIMSYAYLSTICWKPPVHIVLIYNKKLRRYFNSKPMQFATCLSSKALNTARALHYGLGCISPHLEQLEMLLIHSFMLDSSNANTMFH